ncbi:hypothetical protein GN956_G8447 [Arapaima gigas]
MHRHLKDNGEMRGLGDVLGLTLTVAKETLFSTLWARVAERTFWNSVSARAPKAAVDLLAQQQDIWRDRVTPYC